MRRRRLLLRVAPAEGRDAPLFPRPPTPYSRRPPPLRVAGSPPSRRRLLKASTRRRLPAGRWSGSICAVVAHPSSPRDAPPPDRISPSGSPVIIPNVYFTMPYDFSVRVDLSLRITFHVTAPTHHLVNGTPPGDLGQRCPIQCRLPRRRRRNRCTSYLLISQRFILVSTPLRACPGGDGTPSASKADPLQSGSADLRMIRPAGWRMGPDGAPLQCAVGFSGPAGSGNPARSPKAPVQEMFDPGRFSVKSAVFEAGHGPMRLDPGQCREHLSAARNPQLARLGREDCHVRSDQKPVE